MENDYSKADALFEVIPSFLRKPEHVARWKNSRESATFRFLRKPVNLEEINKYRHPLAIWRENNTFTYIRTEGYYDTPKDERGSLSLEFYGYHFLKLWITGERKHAITETATFFMSLAEKKEERKLLVIPSNRNDFDFRSARSQFFKRFFEIDPTRELHLEHMILSIEQSVFLTTRSHSVKLSLWSCTVQDGCTAFVDHLLSRESSFGSLEFAWSPAISDGNLQRLFQSDKIEHLKLPRLKTELALLPFSMQLDSLDYRISFESFLEADFQSLNIVAKKLYLDVYHEGGIIPPECLLSFFRGVAALGHFVELSINIDSDHDEYYFPVPDSVVQELIRAVLANSNMKVFRLCPESLLFYWEPHSATLLKAFKAHKELTEFALIVHDEELSFGPDFIYLRQLLLHDRKFTVVNPNGPNCFANDSIEDLYSLNHFYNGSANLVAEPLTERSSLVMTTLMEMASEDFQRSSLLLSDHVDVLCELVRFAGLNDEHLVRNDRHQSTHQTTVPKRRRI
ncbi:hypothetical protein FisN_14Hu014 [Fistulifera solaris]|uniref:Uncharacterized protein n=1 Tax=Fistulifera solaris TaxID=1519565 RepID=A0A1Z5K8F3_FISSO|nr:hypothetical protein FisN_14Hu014 [Fistulifera solaris]|eukprot:GAX22401.1 hypothetical protein FisN_14Hu014 [Fistulifera solaris]